MTLSLTINETLKWLSSLPVSVQESFWWWQCSNRYITSLFHHLRSSLIILLVSLDIKHPIYLHRSAEAVSKSKTVIILRKISGRTDHPLHKPSKAPESIHFILHDDQNWRQQVTHALDITWHTGKKEKQFSLWFWAMRDSHYCMYMTASITLQKVSLWCTKH